MAQQTNNLGSNLRAIRGRSGLSMADLAEKAHVAWQTVQAIESGTVATPQAVTLARLAEALDVNVGELENGEKPTT